MDIDRLVLLDLPGKLGPLADNCPKILLWGGFPQKCKIRTLHWNCFWFGWFLHYFRHLSV